MKFILGSIVFFSFLTANADWEVTKVIVEKKGATQSTMREALSYAQVTGMTGALEAENLTSLEPIQLKSVHYNMSTYQWENDEDCSVEDPKKIPSITTESFVANYDYFTQEEGPVNYDLLVIPMFPMPCGAPPKYKVIHKVEKKRAK